MGWRFSVCAADYRIHYTKRVRIKSPVRRDSDTYSEIEREGTLDDRRCAGRGRTPGRVGEWREVLQQRHPGATRAVLRHVVGPIEVADESGAPPWVKRTGGTQKGRRTRRKNGQVWSATVRPDAVLGYDTYVPRPSGDVTIT